MELIKPLVLMGLGATIAVLAWGVISMMRGGKEDLEQSTSIMAKRVVIQSVTVGLVLVALLFAMK